MVILDMCMNCEMNIGKANFTTLFSTISQRVSCKLKSDLSRQQQATNAHQLRMDPNLRSGSAPSVVVQVSKVDVLPSYARVEPVVVLRRRRAVVVAPADRVADAGAVVLVSHGIGAVVLGERPVRAETWSNF